MLLGGVELFIEQAPKAARALHVTTLAVALLFAGAEPEELITAATASARGAPGIAFGDLVGANITILTLALGLAALIVHIRVDRNTLNRGAVILIAATPALAFLLWGTVPVWGGLLLVATYFAYVVYVIHRERISPATVAAGCERLAGVPGPATGRGDVLAVGLVLVGLAVMGAGGHFTVEGARGLAEWLKITESAVGLSVVAFATSVEMLFLAVVPALKGHPEISVGGILGSYGYNTTLALGVAALAGPLVAPERWMIAASGLFMTALLVLSILLARKGTLARLDGLLLIALYAAYLSILFGAS